MSFIHVHTRTHTNTHTHVYIYIYIYIYIMQVLGYGSFGVVTKVMFRGQYVACKRLISKEEVCYVCYVCLYVCVCMNMCVYVFLHTHMYVFLHTYTSGSRAAFCIQVLDFQRRCMCSYIRIRVPWFKGSMLHSSDFQRKGMYVSLCVHTQIVLYFLYV